MIEELNDQVKCTLAPSKIHGIGVFALRDIKDGERMYCMGSPNRTRYHLKSLKGLKDEVRTLIIQRWPLALKGESFLSPNDDARLVSFMNHDDNFNYNQYNDVALRDIKSGEEITENYKIVGHWKEIYSWLS